MRDESLAIAEDYYADDCSNDLNECEDNFKKLTIKDQILEPFITPKQLFQKSKQKIVQIKDIELAQIQSYANLDDSQSSITSE